MTSKGYKLAIVLGNSAYKVDPIAMCRQDATDIGLALHRLGFKVIRGRDRDCESMQSLIAQFRQLIISQEPEVAVIYYSGHGLQIKDTNYALPIDFDGESANFHSKLISISDILAEASEWADTTLLFLDACRTNPFVKSINHISQQTALSKGVAASPVIPDGLAAISRRQAMTSNPTFIAFAAAPGEVAYAKVGERNSSFTKSLLAHIETTDLSLDNLMTRVAWDVQTASNQQQEPWKLSSLTTPFYFAAGSLVWFNTNIVGFLAYLVSLGLYTWSLIGLQGGGFGAATGLIMLLAFALFIYGLDRSYRALRGDRVTHSESLWRLTAIGGFFGGIFAAPLITAAYVFFWDVRWGFETPPTGQVLAEILCATVLCGTLLGPLAYNLAKSERFLKLAGDRELLANSFGGAAGGLLTGLIAGPIVTTYFGSQTRPFATPEVLYPGGLLGAMLTIFVILNYEIELFSYRRFITRLMACAASVLIVAAATTLVFLAAYGFMLHLIDGVLGHDDYMTLTIAGLVAGPTVGVVLGAAVGLAYGLDQRFDKWRTLSRMPVLRFLKP